MEFTPIINKLSSTYLFRKFKFIVIRSPVKGLRQKK
jgi:hypothetical protein